MTPEKWALIVLAIALTALAIYVELQSPRDFVDPTYERKLK